MSSGTVDRRITAQTPFGEVELMIVSDDERVEISDDRTYISFDRKELLTALGMGKNYG